MIANSTSGYVDMIRRLAYILVALSTFTISVSAVWVGSLFLAPQRVLTPPDESVLAITGKPKKRFNPTYSACKPGWSQGYETSDGYSLYESGMGYSTQYKADRELRRLVRGAEEIVERGARLDEKGNKAGERVVARFRAESTGKEWIMIIWAEGTVLRTIGAPTLELAIEFEKRPNYPN